MVLLILIGSFLWSRTKRKKSALQPHFFRITSMEIQLLLKWYYGTVQKPSRPTLCRTPYEKIKQVSTNFKICPINQHRLWERLCYVQNCQGSVRDNRYSLQHKKEMMGETKQRHKTCSTFRISQQKDKAIPFSVTPAQAFLSSNLGKLQSIVLHQCQHHKPNHAVHCLKPVFFFFLFFSKIINHIFFSPITCPYSLGILILLSTSES